MSLYDEVGEEYAVDLERRLRRGQRQIEELEDLCAQRLLAIRGDQRVSLLAGGQHQQATLHFGHVLLDESFAGGIEDRERSAGSTLLANVNPTFAWVRLAQRIPVRIRLDAQADRRLLVSGRTATVSVEAPGANPAFHLLGGWRQAMAARWRTTRAA